ncbi:MAG: response regulator [Bullifex sp.]
MLNLVIVDDEFEIVNGLSNYFPWNDIGYTVSGTFTSPEEALDFITGSGKTDVLLTDIRMPEMSGTDLCRKVLETKPSVRCVIISGYREFEYARSCMELGIRDYIVKPTKFNEIKEVFSKIRQELETSSGDRQEHRTVVKVRDYVLKNLANSSLEEVAAHVGLNPFYLSTLFHKETGEKFTEFALRAKMEEARRLLEESSVTIQEISTRLGYMNSNSFSRAFRAYYGTNPRSIRDNQ